MKNYRANFPRRESKRVGAVSLLEAVFLVVFLDVHADEPAWQQDREDLERRDS
jgi:hypothetical protein